MFEILYSQAGDGSWAARCSDPDRGFLVESGGSKGEAIGRLVEKLGLFRLIESPVEGAKAGTIHEDQEILLAVSNDPHDETFMVLGAIGKRANTECFAQNGQEPMIFESTTPSQPGLHVWSGRIEVAKHNFREATWTGAWRPATIEDFARFGLATPVPSVVQETSRP